MKIQTIGAFTAKQVLFTSLFNTGPLELKTTNEGQPKISPDGKPVYRVSLKALALNEKGEPVREERNVSVGLLDPSPIQGGVHYALDGVVWMTPYSNNGQAAISIIAERVVPVSESPHIDVKALSDQMSSKK